MLVIVQLVEASRLFTIDFFDLMLESNDEGGTQMSFPCGLSDGWIFPVDKSDARDMNSVQYQSIPRTLSSANQIRRLLNGSKNMDIRFICDNVLDLGFDVALTGLAYLCKCPKSQPVVPVHYFELIIRTKLDIMFMNINHRV